MRITKRSWVKRLRRVVVVLGLSSCGGEDDSPPADGPFATGLTASATLDSLDRSDAEALCGAFQRLLPRLSNCPSFGMLAAFNLAFDDDYDDGGALPTDRRLQTACSDTRRQCEASLRESVTSEAPADCSGSVETCSGTVEQFEACINDFLPLVEAQVGSTPSCELLRCSTFPDSARQWIEVTQAPTAAGLPSCQAFFATCPSPEPTLSPPSDGNAPDELPPLVCGE